MNCRIENNRVVFEGEACRWVLLEEPRNATPAERAQGAGRCTAIGVHKVALALATVTAGPCVGATKKVLFPLRPADCLAFEVALAGRA